MDKRVVYKGHGFYIGLPARDMTLDEWRSYPKALIEVAMKAGLYQIVDEKKEIKTDEQGT